MREEWEERSFHNVRLEILPQTQVSFLWPSNSIYIPFKYISFQSLQNFFLKQWYFGYIMKLLMLFSLTYIIIDCVFLHFSLHVARKCTSRMLKNHSLFNMAIRIFFLSFSLTFLVFNGCWAFFRAAYQTLHFLKHFTFFLHYCRLFRLWKPSYDEQQQQQPTTTTTTTMLSLKQQMIVCLAFVANGQQ